MDVATARTDGLYPYLHCLAEAAFRVLAACVPESVLEASRAARKIDLAVAVVDLLVGDTGAEEGTREGGNTHPSEDSQSVMWLVNFKIHVTLSHILKSYLFHQYLTHGLTLDAHLLLSYNL
jgi:hypothetical protein